MNHPVIAIVGCGFIGSHLAEEIPKLMYSQDLFPFKLRFIDFDRWEDRNSANQNVSFMDAHNNEFKAETCAKYASNYPQNEVEAVTEKLTIENANKLLGDAVLVIDAVDNIPTRQLMWSLAKGGATGPCLHAGISRKGDGIINWSSPIFDTFPFDPVSLAGRKLAEQDVKEPPCEMYKYRSNGMVLFQAIAKAVSLYLGRDPWEILGMGSDVEKGMMTCWTTNESGASLLVDDVFLDKDNEFLPIFNKGV